MQAEIQSGLNQAQAMLEALFARIPDNLYLTLAIKGTSNKLISVWYPADANGIAELCGKGMKAAADADVYFSTCPALNAPVQGSKKRISQKDVACIPALFVDIDTLEDPAKTANSKQELPDTQASARAMLEALPFPPSIIVNSGHGLHAYWMLEEPLQAVEGKNALKAFSEAVKTVTGWDDMDSSASEPARILRLPGTYNHKHQGMLPVSLLSSNGARYSWAALEDFIQQTIAEDEPLDFEEYESSWIGEAEPGEPLSDDALIEKAMNAKNGLLFTELWRGNTAAYNSDDSKADASLCALLAFWTAKDAARIDRLFRRSGLMRDKWDEVRYADGGLYGAVTIQRAIALQKNSYTPGVYIDRQASNSALIPFYNAYDKVNGFGMKDGKIIAKKQTKDGEVDIPLATFSALITQEITRDDGATTKKEYRIEGRDCWGGELPAVNVKTSEYAGLDWAQENWGTTANIYPGRSNKDMLRFAIMEASKNAVPSIGYRSVYAHTGWKKINGKLVYLYNGGGVGSDDVDVELEDAFSHYQLPPKVDDPIAAILASLQLLDVAPYRVAMPVFAHTYLAPLCHYLRIAKHPPAFVLFLSGRTGTRKSTLAALEMNHFGAAWSASRMPASFSDTSGSLRYKGFTCKDMPLLVDDYHPTNSPQQKAAMTQKAHDMLTAYGDSASRGRLNADLKAASSQPPGGVCIITGEDAPNVTESGTARCYTVEIKQTDIPVSDALNQVQAAGSSGLLSEAMRAYVEYLSHFSEDELVKTLSDAFVKYRAQTTAALPGAHGRLANAAAHLWLSLRCALDCFVAYGAIPQAESDVYFEDGKRAILDNVAIQQEDMKQEEAPRMYLQAIHELLISGKCQLYCADLTAAPMYEIIGFYDDKYLYLLPGIAFNAVESYYRERRTSFPIEKSALEKRLDEEKLLNRRGQNQMAATTYIPCLHTSKRVLNVCRSKLSEMGCDPCGDREEVPQKITPIRQIYSNALGD